VESAIEKAKQSVAGNGMYLDSSVIAHPDEQICRSIL
ncbi:MAG: propanediol utilization protein, partial [Eisenbergiella massiliensis]|nr:propanediol utilization protein [Eisenbergiella massiliensis]